MDLSYLKKLVRILEHSGVDEIEVEEEGLRIRVARNSQVHTSSGAIVSGYPAQGIGVPPPSATIPTEVPALAAVPEKSLHEIKSPIVGTFYRAPAPDADSYVEVGQTVQSKTVLCIIEAMKLMNEIESDVSGQIVKILVENGQPVEYNQTLFLIEPA